MIIDSEREIYVGVGHNFPPTILGQTDIMMPAEVANYLGKSIGDNVVISLDLTGTIGEDPLAKLMALMTMGMENIVVDIGERVIKHNESRISFESVGIDLSGTWFDYTIANTFNKSDGKFGSVWGNVALIDCNYVFDNLLDKTMADAAPLFIFDHSKWKEIRDMVDETRAYNDYYNVTLCNWAYELDGVLKDQSSYYLGSEAQILGGISDEANVIVD